jgi:undecaprenyl-diphosphatase
VNLVTSLDHAILEALNDFAGRSWAFDEALGALATYNLIKGGLVMALVWWAWFRSAQDRRAGDRRHLIATLIGCLAALGVGRLLVVVLPFRVRPLHDSDLHLVVPFGLDDSLLAKASSFPSDHAVLFFGLATGLFLLSRRVGTVVALYTFVVIGLPRMYLGFHYFSDIVAGAAIGAGICWLANRFLAGSRGVQWLERWSSAQPMYFYPLLFLVTYQIAELFDSSRAIVRGLLKLVGD